MFKRVLTTIVGLMITLAPIATTTPASAGCEAADFSFALGPYESKTFDLCAWGSPFVNATASNGSDIDGVLTDAYSGDVVASDSDLTSIVWLGGYGFSSGYYRYTITNTSGNWTRVDVEEANL